MHKPESALQNKMHNILCDFEIIQSKAEEQT